jgi:hypothetical protein
MPQAIVAQSRIDPSARWRVRGTERQAVILQLHHVQRLYVQLRCAEAGTSAAEIEAIKRTLKLPGKEHERLES